MKKLLFVLPLALLLFSCADESTNVIEEEQFNTVYGLVRTFENSQIAGIIGDTSNNHCSNKTEINFLTYPNPTAFGVTIDFNSDTSLSYDIYLETALGDESLIDSLESIRYPSPILIPEHTTYSKNKLATGKAEKGSNSLHIDLKNYNTGIYYLIYEDSEGTSGCYPLVIQRYEG